MDHEAHEGTRAGRRVRDGAEPPATPATPPSAATAVGQRRAAAGQIEPTSTQAGRGRDPDTDERDAGTASPPSTDDDVVRFGPGVPAPATVPDWSSSASASAPTRAPSRRRRPGRWVAGLATLLILAGVVAFLLLHGGSTAAVQHLDVRASPATATCDTTVDVIGTIITDGRAGTVRYQWLRSDGQISEVLTQTVAGGTTSTDVHLQWSVTGQGRLAATATLRVLDPTPTEAAGGFTYSCS